MSGRHSVILSTRYIVLKLKHSDDVIMTMLASQITSLTVVYSIVYSDVNQRKHQSSASLAFVREFTGDRWISRTNGQLRGKCFHLMTSSWTSWWVGSSIILFLQGLFDYMSTWLALVPRTHDLHSCLSMQIAHLLPKCFNPRIRGKSHDRPWVLFLVNVIFLI